MAENGHMLGLMSFNLKLSQTTGTQILTYRKQLVLLSPQLWKFSDHLLPLRSRSAPNVSRTGCSQAVADPILQGQCCLRCCRCSTQCCCRCSSGGCCCCWSSCCSFCCCSSCGGSRAAKKQKTNEEGGPRTTRATVHPKTNEKEGSIYQQSCNLSQQQQFLFITGIAVNWCGDGRRSPKHRPAPPSLFIHCCSSFLHICSAFTLPLCFKSFLVIFNFTEDSLLHTTTKNWDTLWQYNIVVVDASHIFILIMIRATQSFWFYLQLFLWSFISHFLSHSSWKARIFSEQRYQAHNVVQVKYKRQSANIIRMFSRCWDASAFQPHIQVCTSESRSIHRTLLRKWLLQIFGFVPCTQLPWCWWGGEMRQRREGRWLQKAALLRRNNPGKKLFLNIVHCYSYCVEVILERS